MASPTRAKPHMLKLNNRNEYTRALMPDKGVPMEKDTKSCQICRGIRPIVTDSIKKLPSATFYILNIDEAEDIPLELGVRNVPSFSIFKDGLIWEGITGLKLQDFERAIKESYEGEIVESNRIY